MQEKSAPIEFIEKCYQLYEQKMFQVAYCILHDSGWSEDAVQEAFVKLMKSGKYFKDAESDDCKRYIITVIKHSAIDIYNRKKREQKIIFLSEEVYKGAVLAEGGSAERGEIRELISGLPVKYYDVVDCLIIKGLSVKETSGELNISEANVRKRFERAKKMLKVSWTRKSYI